MYDELIKNLELDLEWAEANEWESPICLSDDIMAVLDIIKNLQLKYGTWVNYYKSGTIVKDGYVSTCCDMWNNRKSEFCPCCGSKMINGGI